MDVQRFVEFLVAVVAYSTLAAFPVFVVVLIVTRLGRRWIAPWARQALWSLVLLRLLLPVSFGCPVSLQSGALRLYDQADAFLSRQPARLVRVRHVENPGGPPIAVIEPASIRSQTEISDPESSAEPSQVPCDWQTVLGIAIPGMLIGGLVFIPAWTMICTLRIRRRVCLAPEFQRADWLELLAEGRRLFGVRSRVSLRIVPKLSGPATYGWWRPAILLPEDAANWSAIEMRHVVWHELAHIRRRDVAANWVLAMVRVFHWWNPLYWIAQRHWLAERELACDAMVLQRLEGENVRSYGETLLRFVARLSTRGSDVPASVAGFVFFWGRKRAVRRRLKELPRLVRSEKTWSRWIAVIAILSLGILSLTDATPAQSTNSGMALDRGNSMQDPIELPEGTTWNALSPKSEKDPGLKTSCGYDLSATIRRYQEKLTPDWPLLKVTRLLEQSLQLTLQPGSAEPSVNAVQRDLTPEVPVRGRLRAAELAAAQARNRNQPAKCLFHEKHLLVNASMDQQAEMRKLIYRWNEQGQRSVQVETILATTTWSLNDLAPGPGGTVSSIATEIASRQSSNVDLLAPAASIPQRIPIFAKVLTEAQANALVARLNGYKRSEVTYCPKLTFLEAQAGLNSSTVQRPFVTGFRTRRDGNREPEISLISEGMRLQVCPLLSGDEKVLTLLVQHEQTTITDVEVLQMVTSGTPTSVQLPRVSQFIANVMMPVPAGHSLLLAPLRRDFNRKLPICLIRPQVVR